MSVASRFFGEFEKTLPRMEGQRVAITGTTSGTGLIAARTMLNQGAEVFMLNRESERAQSALKALEAEFPSGKVHQIACDCMDFASVREAAREVKEKCSEGGLDVLANNAGIMNFPDKATKDGFDVQMQTNHLSHFLLVKELLPCLQIAAKAKGEARIVHVSSFARHGPALDAKYFAKNGGNIGDSGGGRYHMSKLANVVFTYALADKFTAANLNIKALVVAPGVSDTNLLQLPGCVNWFCGCLKKVAMQSSEDGTMPLLTAIAMKDVQQGDLILPSRGFNGEVWGPVKTLRRPVQAPEEAVCQDVPSQKMLWDESEHAILEKFEL